MYKLEINICLISTHANVKTIVSLVGGRVDIHRKSIIHGFAFACLVVRQQNEIYMRWQGK